MNKNEENFLDMKIKNNKGRYEFYVYLKPT